MLKAKDVTTTTTFESATRRAVLAGLAGALAVAAPAVGTAASQYVAGSAVPRSNIFPNWDEGVTKAGESYEAIFRKYLDDYFDWSRLMRDASDRTDAAFPEVTYYRGDHPKALFLARTANENGCDAANDRMHVLDTQLDALADKIRDAEIRSVEGLRAKVLVAMRDCLPTYARHRGYFEYFGESPESHYSLFLGAAVVLG